jgi:hypothetical protein
MEFDINNRVRKLQEENNQEENNQESFFDQEYYDEDDDDFDEFEGCFENLVVEHSEFDFGPLLIKYLNSEMKPEKIQKEKEKKPKKVKKLNSMEIKYKLLDSSNSIVVGWKKPKEFHHVNGYEVFCSTSNENKINKLKMNVIEVKKKIVFSFFHKKSERVCKIKFLKPNTDYCVYVQYLNEERILLPAGFQYFRTLKNPKNK